MKGVGIPPLRSLSLRFGRNDKIFGGRTLTPYRVERLLGGIDCLLNIFLGVCGC
jgi:hypothetical protein